MEENAAQKHQIQEKNFDLRTAEAEIEELRKHQYVCPDLDAPISSNMDQQQHQQQQRNPNQWYVKTTKKRSPVGGQYVNLNPSPLYNDQYFAPTAFQPKVANYLPQREALEVFLKRASDNNHMRAREIGLKALERGRPDKLLQ